jgi:uncharacterized protein YndB with AHSA1/START domain
MKPTETKHELKIVTPSDREIAMTRVLDAPRQRVFDAFTKPELIRRWLLGPEGWSMTVCDVDLRVGGSFHYVWRNDAERKEFGLGGGYREIVRPERIVHAENFDEPWYPGDALVTSTFVEQHGSTTVTMTILYDSREVRDMAIESGMERGVAVSFDRLAELLDRTAA